MLKIYRYQDLGHVDHGWLNARHHFSFASYYDKNRLGFGTLKVINDDLIQAGKGFPPHHHDNMEIITYIRSGAITHQDDHDHEGVTMAGNVQVMSAGSGIRHSEYNLSDQQCSLYQIWIEPNKENVTPCWDQMQFPNQINHDKLPLLVSGNKNDAALFINQDTRIYGGKIAKASKISQAIKYQAYILVSSGTIIINDQELNKGDGAELTAAPNLEFRAKSEAEVIIIDTP